MREEFCVSCIVFFGLQTAAMLKSVPRHRNYVVDMVHPRDFNRWNNSCRDAFFQFSSLKRVESVPVIHCADSYGLILSFDLGKKQDFKMVYTGDTRPYSAVENVGCDADLLIHEVNLSCLSVAEWPVQSMLFVVNTVFPHCGRQLLTIHVRKMLAGKNTRQLEKRWMQDRECGRSV
jgi:hypothetical protein